MPVSCSWFSASSVRARVCPHWIRCLIPCRTCCCREQASLDVEDPALQALIASLPELPAAARRQCLEACGLVDGDGSYTFDYDN